MSASMQHISMTITKVMLTNRAHECLGCSHMSASMQRVSITTTEVPCSATICQKSAVVLASGPCVAMYW